MPNAGVIVIVALLWGCGNKGPLTLPESPDNAKPVDTQSNSSDTADEAVEQ